MWPLACVFRKPLLKIHVRETHVREGKKEKSYCANTFELHWIKYFVRLLLLRTNKKQNGS